MTINQVEAHIFKLQDKLPWKLYGRFRRICSRLIIVIKPVISIPLKCSSELVKKVEKSRRCSETFAFVCSKIENAEFYTLL